MLSWLSLFVQVEWCMGAHCCDFSVSLPQRVRISVVLHACGTLCNEGKFSVSLTE